MLKQLLQLLLNTRTTPEEAAHSAMPSDKYTRLVDNGTIGSEWTAQAFSGIAAYDGYLFFAGTSTSAVPIVGIATAGCASNLTFPWEGARLATTIPIAKGIQCTVQGRNLKNIAISLYKTIGGGYQTLKNALLQGGGLCLSHWYSSLQRNSYRTSGSGWLISQQFLFKALLNYLLLQMEKVTHSRCRTRGLSTSEVMEFGLPILEGSISSISDHLRMGIFRSGLTLKKVKNLPTQLGNQISSLLPIFEYTKSRGTIDQMFGGASC